MKFFNKLSTKVNNAVIENEKSANRAVKAYYTALASIASVAVATSPLFAISDIFSKVSATLQDIYKEIIGISTVLAVTMIAVCLIIRMVSKNQRSVEEATSWAKRIAITWIILNGLSFIVAYGKNILGDANTVNPWNA